MTDHVPGEDCPYCLGTLSRVEGATYQCDGGDCPARFVAVLGAAETIEE